MNRQFIKTAFFTAALLLLGTATQLAAQQAGQQKTPEQRATIQTERLDQILGLTEAQKKEVYQLSLDRAQKLSALNAKKGDDLRAARKQANQGHRQAVQQILTPAQKQILAERRAKRKAAAGQGQ